LFLLIVCGWIAVASLGIAIIRLAQHSDRNDAAELADLLAVRRLTESHYGSSDSSVLGARQPSAGRSRAVEPGRRANG
jgi:hypothetical protein